VCLRDESGTRGQWAWACPPAQQLAPRVLTNELVIAMVKDGRIFESSIIGAIMTLTPHFSLAPGDLTTLRASGATEFIIAAMRERARMAGAPPSPATTPTDAPPSPVVNNKSTPQPDAQKIYNCGYFEGGLKALEATDGVVAVVAGALWENLRRMAADCDEVHKYVQAPYPPPK
jgi:hypothetical protein